MISSDSCAHCCVDEDGKVLLSAVSLSRLGGFFCSAGNVFLLLRILLRRCVSPVSFGVALVLIGIGQFKSCLSYLKVPPGSYAAMVVLHLSFFYVNFFRTNVNAFFSFLTTGTLVHACYDSSPPPLCPCCCLGVCRQLALFHSFDWLLETVDHILLTDGLMDATQEIQQGEEEVMQEDGDAIDG